MQEIDRWTPDYIGRRLVLAKADGILKTLIGTPEDDGAQAVVKALTDVIAEKARPDIVAKKEIERPYGLIYCDRCRTVVSESDRFCRRCGGRFV